MTSTAKLMAIAEQSMSGLTLSRNRIIRPIASAMYLLVTMTRWAIALPSQSVCSMNSSTITGAPTSAPADAKGSSRNEGALSGRLFLLHAISRRSS